MHRMQFMLAELSACVSCVLHTHTKAKSSLLYPVTATVKEKVIMVLSCFVALCYWSKLKDKFLKSFTFFKVNFYTYLTFLIAIQLY